MTGENADFWELAACHGVIASYTDVHGRPQRASPDTVFSVLQALGVPIQDPNEAGPLLRAQKAAVLRRCFEPVLVHRIGRKSAVVATLPAAVDPDDLWLSIDLEQGDTLHLRPRQVTTCVTRAAGNEDARYQHLEMDLTQPNGVPLPPGRHTVTLEGAGSTHSALLVSAPKCPTARRRTGLFMPLHALRTATDWGIGSYSDLERLSNWATSTGCDLVGTLPLYPAFLTPPADPSPYMPVSRLAYNEVFIDPVTLPEFTATSDVHELCSSSAFRAHLATLRSSALVDYEEVARLKRLVLEQMAQTVESGALPQRRRELEEFVRRRPELDGYARFRARLDSPSGEERPSTVAYHRYCQWVAHDQLLAAGRHSDRYGDFPIGSHPAGFDPEWYPDSFVHELHGGAPPDRFFPLGQDWGFHPLHPERIREDGYAFLSAALRRAFLHADCLRIDHVMGLHRLFMIPKGGGEGAYVSYHADELHAIVALEAARADAVVVGEDLGTVPDELRPRMAQDGMLRTWVFQFESTPDQPLPAPPAESLSSIGTHDLPRFGAYLWGDDIADREAAGYISVAEATREWRAREAWRRRLFDALGLPDTDDAEKLTSAALEGCLFELVRSDAAIVLIALQELWDERDQENVPGSGPEGANWRRRSSRTMEEIEADPGSNRMLCEMATGRQG